MVASPDPTRSPVPPRSTAPVRPARGSTLTVMAATAGVIAALYFGRQVLVPLALSMLLSFLLAPAVRRVERLGARRGVAVGVVTVAALAPLLFLGWMVWAEFVTLADAVPRYQSRIAERVEAIQGPMGRMLDRATKALQEVGKANPEEGTAEQPVAVKVVDPPLASVQVVRKVIGPLAAPTATAGMVGLFVIVILVKREDLRDRFIRLVSRGRLGVTTQALDELAERVSRFLRMQFLVNLTYGVCVGVGLWFIGVPGGLAWGVVCIVLRFIPYLGPVVGAAVPIVLSALVFPGWSEPLQTAGMFAILELVINNLVEPWLYGTRTGVSVMAVLVAAVFWAWLWGLPGLLLSMPLTVSLVVAGRYVPQLAFLHVLLGDEPVLPEPTRLYQRLLAGDADEALEIAEAYITAHSLTALYDEALTEVLRMLGEDSADGSMEPGRLAGVLEGLNELVDETAAFAGATEPGRTPGAGEPPLRVLCVPARLEADAAASRMLAHLLGRAGIAARAISVADLGLDIGAVLADYRPDALVISGAPPHAAVRARLRLRQVLRKRSEARVVVGLWGSSAKDGESPSGARLLEAGAGAVRGSMDSVVTLLTETSRAPSVNADAA